MNKRPIDLLELHSEYHDVQSPAEKIRNFARGIRPLGSSSPPQRKAISPIDVYLDRIRAAGKKGDVDAVCDINNGFIDECERHAAKEREERRRRQE